MANERKRRRWPAMVLVLLMLYALSPPPVFWLLYRLAVHGYVGEREIKVAEALAVVYWPLQQISEACPPVRQFYEWYTELFAISD